MRRPTFVSTEDKDVQSGPFLIIDSRAFWGPLVISYIQKTLSIQTIFVGGADTIGLQGVQHIPFRKKIPKLPDMRYGYIVVFFNGEEEIIEALPEFIEKAKRDKARFYFVCKKGEVGSSITDQFKKDENASIIWLGDVFGGGVEYDPSVVVHRYLEEAHRRGQIVVENMGMQKTYPIHLDDAVPGIVAALFSQTKSKEYGVFPKNSPTQLSLAWLLQKQNPLLKIDFAHQPNKVERDEEFLGEHVVPDPYPLQKRLLHTTMADFTKTNRIVVKKEERYEMPSGGRRHMSYRGFIVSLLFMIVFAPLVLTMFFSAFAMLTTSGSAYALSRNDIATAKTSLGFSQALSFLAGSSVRLFEMETSFLGGDWGSALENNIAFVKDSQDGLSYGIDTAQVVQAFLAGNVVNPNDKISAGVGSAKRALLAIQKLKAEYQGLKAARSMLLPTNLLENAFNFVDSLDTITTLFGNTADWLPELFGTQGKKTYLVLFQNNMELRPTGGFIGSYAIVQINKGKLEQFTIQDVYDADGQLKAHLEPPFAIRRYLPSVHWYLRDSNYNLDFGKAASSSAQLLKLETGQQVDGVIAIDAAFVKSLLRVTGPLYVADYKETVDENNFYTLTQEHAQKNFFPGSTQKKDFLRTLLTTMSNQIFVNKRFSYKSLLEVINESLSKKHILFAFANQQIHAAFEGSGVSSSTRDTRSDDEIKDTIGINEANLGVNKENYFIKRKISYYATVQEDGTISSREVVWYKNTDTTQSNLYKAYLRVITPANSVIQKILIDGVEQKITPAITDPQVYESKTFKAPERLEVEEVAGDTIKTYGFLIQVPAGGLKKIEVLYAPTLKLDTTSSSTYSLKVYKQPGTDDDQLEVFLQYPKTLTAQKYTPFVQQGTELRFNGRLDRDIILRVTYGNS